MIEARRTNKIISCRRAHGNYLHKMTTTNSKYDKKKLQLTENYLLMSPHDFIN